MKQKINDLPFQAIGRAVFQYRKKKGWSAEEMAAVMLVTPDIVKNIESGRTKLGLDHFINICKSVNASPSKILKELGVTFH